MSTHDSIPSPESEEVIISELVENLVDPKDYSVRAFNELQKYAAVYIVIDHITGKFLNFTDKSNSGNVCRVRIEYNLFRHPQDSAKVASEPLIASCRNTVAEFSVDQTKPQPSDNAKKRIEAVIAELNRRAIDQR